MRFKHFLLYILISVVGIQNSKAQLIGPDVDSFQNEIIHWASNDFFLKDALTHDSVWVMDTSVSLFAGNVPSEFFGFISDSMKVIELAQGFLEANEIRSTFNAKPITLLKNRVVTTKYLEAIFPKGGLEDEWNLFHKKRPKTLGFAYLSKIGFSKGYEYGMIEFGVQTGSGKGRSVVYLLKRDFREWKLVTSFTFLNTQ